MLFYLELYFLIQWEDRDEEDGHDLLDVLPAKAIVVDSDANLELLGEGDNCIARLYSRRKCTQLPLLYCRKW